jgi:hypothetical protein
MYMLGNWLTVFTPVGTCRRERGYLRDESKELAEGLIKAWTKLYKTLKWGAPRAEGVPHLTDAQAAEQGMAAFRRASAHARSFGGNSSLLKDVSAHA